MRHIGDAERRARLGRRHHLATRAKLGDVTALAGDLVGFHGTDPATVFLSAAARLTRPASAVAALEDALYERRTLVRMLGMRRTMFVVPLDLVPVVQAACTDALAVTERRKLIALIESHGIAEDGAGWLRRAEAATVAALDGSAGRTGVELSKAVPQLREQLHFGQGRKWEGLVGLSTRVLFLLSTEQRIVRGRPKGRWTSTQYRWVAMDEWLPAARPRMAAAEARAALLDRWLAAFGPATEMDIRWWTGWAATYARAALAAIGAVEVTLDEGPGWVRPGDEEPVRRPAPWVALLPALDPTTMGWQARAWYLGSHGPRLFDRSGNAGPTVWVDGRIVGGWAQRPDGEVVHQLLEDVGREVAAAVDRAAADLTAWFGGMWVKPRFGTPLQRELEA
jgi:hypothetical protein